MRRNKKGVSLLVLVVAAIVALVNYLPGSTLHNAFGSIQTAASGDSPARPGSVTTSRETLPLASVDGLLSIHFIDVGNADAILISCDGENLLIDAGENNQGNLVASYLAANGVDKLKYAIGTHPHSDHIGGMDTVLSLVDTEAILMPDSRHTTKTYLDVLEVIKTYNVELIVPRVGDVFYIGGAVMTVLSPIRDYDDFNDDSIVVRIVYGANSFLLAGDATRIAEEDMLSSGLPLDSDVLKVGHHGSYTSSSYVFLREVMPKYVIIPCGSDNEYGHPHEEVMSRLKDLEKVHGTQIFRSDLNGTVVMISDGTTISVEAEKK